jgi:uncharacterized protein DUF4440
MPKTVVFFWVQSTLGQWQNKDEFIKELQDKKNKWKNGNISDVNVATFGANTAVAHYKFTYDAEIGGTHRVRSVICSDTWVNDSGTWKSASTRAISFRANENSKLNRLRAGRFSRSTSI